MNRIRVERCRGDRGYLPGWVVLWEDGDRWQPCATWAEAMTAARDLVWTVA